MPAIFISATYCEYLDLLALLNPFSRLMKMKKGATWAIPTVAARMNAFCRPMSSTQGDAVADGEAHGVADQDDGHDGLAAQVTVAVDVVRHAGLQADGDDEGDHAHGEHEAEPVDRVRGADAPEYQPEGDEGDRGQQDPEPVLGFHDAVVALGEFDQEPVAEGASVNESEGDAWRMRGFLSEEITCRKGEVCC